MKLIDLSHPSIDGQSAFPNDPSLTVRSHTNIAENKCRVSAISFGSHHGTHLDAMSHFIPDGKPIEKMPLEWFFGPACLVRIPKNAGSEITVEDFQPYEHLLAPGARIIYETGWHRRYGKSDYFTDFPSLTQEAASYLAAKQIRMLGMDTPTPSRDYYEVHHILLGSPAEIVVVESLNHLDQLPDEFTFVGFPLLFQGCDGSPIRAVALVD